MTNGPVYPDLHRLCPKVLTHTPQTRMDQGTARDNQSCAPVILCVSSRRRLELDASSRCCSPAAADAPLACLHVIE
jgi:hypothetical protein